MDARVLGIAAVALVSGAGNSFVSKVLFDIPCPASCATATPSCTDAASSAAFNKPIFATAIAFAGMTACVILWAGEVVAARYSACFHRADVSTAARSRRACAGRTPSSDGVTNIGARKALKETEATPLLRGGINSDAPAAPSKPHVCVRIASYVHLVLPATLDVLATALQLGATVFLPAAVNAALRGSLCLCVYVCAHVCVCVRVRDRDANRLELLGILTSTAAVALVGLSAVLDSSASSSNSSLSPAAASTIGVTLSLASNVAQAVQVVYETKFLEASTFTPNEVNTVEGIIGVAVCALALLVFQFAPRTGADVCRVENTQHTLCCLAASPALRATTAALWVLFTVSTAAHMYLSLYRGSHFRSFILVARAALVWAFELIAYYGKPATAGSYGSPWAAHSWLEAVGVAMLGVGGALQWIGQSRRASSGN